MDSGFSFGYLKIFIFGSGSQYFNDFWIPEPVYFGLVQVPDTYLLKGLILIEITKTVSYRLLNKLNLFLSILIIMK